MFSVPIADRAAAVAAPTGAAFDIVLLLHVACVLVALASTFVTGTQAWRARGGPSAPSADSVTRYFRPGVNWPGRALYGVLVFGFLLVAMSAKAYSFGDLFVQLGFVLWIMAAGLAELVVWPAERLLQRTISQQWGAGGSSPPVTTSRQIAVRVAASAWAVCAVMLVATVVMFQKP